MTTPLEFGLDTFGDVTNDASGAALPHAQVIRNLVEEAVLADELGVDFIGLGEHHRADFAISSPEVVLAAIAARTSRIRLGSAVTVLSSDDPVRVFQRFATLDAVSDGRAEVILGRGSFTESFPLFGFDLSQYEELFGSSTCSRAVEQRPLNWQDGIASAARGPACVSAGRTAPLKTWIGWAAARSRWCARRNTSADDARHHRRRSSGSLPTSISIIGPSGVRTFGQGDRRAFAWLYRRK
jgi:hypothetical protein